MNRILRFSILIALCILIPCSAAFAQRGEAIDQIQEGLQFSVVGFSMTNKTVVVEVTDHQRGSYFSVYKTRTGEKIKDYPFTDENKDRVLKRVKRKEAIDDEGAEGPVSPKDGSVITGFFNGKDVTIQVQAGKDLGVLDVILPPKNSPKISGARVKGVHWNSKGKLFVLFVVWEFAENGFVNSETLHVYRYRPWKIRWQ